MNEIHELPLANRLVDDLIREWIDIALNLMRAATGTHTAEERARQKAIDEVQYMALADYSSALTPAILDALRRAGMVTDDPA
jgi:hypothetical protein